MTEVYCLLQALCLDGSVPIRLERPLSASAPVEESALKNGELNIIRSFLPAMIYYTFT